MDEISRNLTKLALLPEENPNPVIITDSTGVITYLNPAAHARFPKLNSNRNKHPLLEDIPIMIKLAAKKKRKILAREVRVDDHIFDQQIAIDPDNCTVRIYIHDITLSKHRERLKGNFAGSVSHELRGPLAASKGIVGNLKNGLLGPLQSRQKSALDVVESNLCRMDRIIDNILELSRLESGKAKLDFQSVILPTLIREIIESFRSVAFQQELALQDILSKDLPHAYGDPDLIMEVLTNLLSNAFRFSKTKIVIKAKSTKNYLRITVTDDGPGIAKEDISRIFNRFEQIRRLQGRDGYKGTGLGLALCKEIVRRHGGRIWVRSKIGRETTFNFTVPRYDTGKSRKMRKGKNN